MMTASLLTPEFLFCYASHTITAADPGPDDLRAVLTKINNASRSAH
jgi:hypothetical protein